MNGWGFVVIGLGVLAIIAAVKGTGTSILHAIDPAVQDQGGVGSSSGPVLTPSPFETNPAVAGMNAGSQSAVGVVPVHNPTTFEPAPGFRF